jgi:lipopolysaccharide transport system permease protein
MLAEIIRIIKCREIVFYLIDQEQKVLHRDKLLGNVWMLLNPLLMMIVLFWVFKNIRNQPAAFCLYVFTGLLAWDIFSKAIMGCTLCLRARKGLIQKFPLPLAIFPIAVVFRTFYNMVFGVLSYVAMFFFTKFIFLPQLSLSPYIFFLPVWMFFFMLMILGFGFILARIGVYFQDMKDIVEVLLRVGFFLNPIFLHINYFGPSTQPKYFLLNPLGGYLMLFREVLPGGRLLVDNYQIPVHHYPCYLAVFSIFIFFFGFWVFQNGMRQYAKYL